MTTNVSVNCEFRSYITTNAAAETPKVRPNFSNVQFFLDIMIFVDFLDLLGTPEDFGCAMFSG